MNTMEIKSKNYAQFGFYICALSVAFGAMGTHLLEEVVSQYNLDRFETAVRYQFFHGIAIAFLALNYRKLNDKYLQYILPLFIVSILIFSGTLYLMVFFSVFMGDDFKWLGAITPLGGAGFILGWVLLGVKGFDEYDTVDKSSSSSSSSRSSSSKRHRKHRRSSSSSSSSSSTDSES